MALNFSVELRNARLDAIETVAGTSPILEIRSGAKPANAAAARTGTIGASMTLPADWAAAAASGAKAKSGTWEDLLANADITAGYFTLYKSDGTTVVLQGSITATGGGGDMELITTTIVTGQPVVVSTWTITDGNA